MPEPSIQNLAQRVERAMQAQRRRIPLTTLDAPAGVFFTATRWRARPYAQPMIWLATKGCQHVERHGGCTMCDFGRGNHPHEELIAGLHRVLHRLGDAPLIHLAIPGSLLDESEIPSDLRRQIIETAAAHGAEAIGIEARTEDIRCEPLVELVRFAQGAAGSRLRELSVGTGVETFDEDVLRVCVNKGSSRAVARQALNAVKCANSQLEDVTVVAEAHVLLKPPALTELEAIDDATAAIEWALSAGFERAILMLCSAKPHTPLAAPGKASGMMEAGIEYRPPSLWSAIEVLSRLPGPIRGNVRVHGFASNTPLGVRPTSCSACEQVVVAAIQHFNSTGTDDYLDAVRGLGCECRDRWLATCDERPQASLRSRMCEFVDALERASVAEEPPA